MLRLAALWGLKPRQKVRNFVTKGKKHSAVAMGHSLTKLELADSNLKFKNLNSLTFNGF